MKKLIQLWCSSYSTNETSAEVVKEICVFLCEYYGGHIYPTVRFMEYVFRESSNNATPFIRNLDDFYMYFFSEEFSKSFVYESIFVRCFRDLFEKNSNTEDMMHLEKIGF